VSVLSEIQAERIADGVMDLLSLPNFETVGGCPQWIKVRQDGCGEKRWILVPCSNPLCVPCSKIRAAQVRARWEPILKRMRAPRMITLTTQSGFDLRQVRKDFQSFFRRLLDLRLGKRGLDELIEAALDFVHNPSGELPEQKLQDIKSKTAAWEKKIKLFRSTCERKRVTLGKSPRMRDVIGPGFASYEVTWHDAHGWHFHRHLTTDGAFIPWPVLVAAWKVATEGKGEIVDIRLVDKSADSIQELIKYTAKAWEIPQERAQELRLAVFGMKRVWPLGGAKPSKVKAPCPCCHLVDCRPHPISGVMATLYRGTRSDGTRYAVVGDGQMSAVVIRTWHAWVEAPALDLIRGGFACQSQGP